MTALRLPFSAKSLAALAYAISQARYAPLPPPPTSSSSAKKPSSNGDGATNAAAAAAVRALVRGLLKKDPTERPSMEQILAEPSLAERLDRIARHWPSSNEDVSSRGAAASHNATAANSGTSNTPSGGIQGRSEPVMTMVTKLKKHASSPMEQASSVQSIAQFPAPVALMRGQTTDGNPRQQAEALAAQLAQHLAHLQPSAPSQNQLLSKAPMSEAKPAALSSSMPAALSALEALSHLDLSHGGIDACNMLKELATSFLLHSRMCSLKLSGVQLNQVAVDQLALLIARAPQLSLLDVAKTGISSSMVDRILAAAFSSPTRHASSIGLDLSYNLLGEGAMQALSRHLPLGNSSPRGGGVSAALPRLTILLLRRCALGDAGIANISSLCAAHGALEHVDFSLNQVQRRFAWSRHSSVDLSAPLASLLHGCAGLRSLTIANDTSSRPSKGFRCDRKPFRSLAAAISEHASLTSLDLTGLRLDEASVADFAQMLPSNTSILTLNIPAPTETDSQHNTAVRQTTGHARDVLTSIIRRNCMAAACRLASGDSTTAQESKSGHSSSHDTRSNSGFSTDKSTDPLVGHIERAAAFAVLSSLGHAAETTLPSMPGSATGSAGSPGSNESEKTSGSKTSTSGGSNDCASQDKRHHTVSDRLSRRSSLVDGSPQPAPDYALARVALAGRHEACMKALGVALTEAVPLGLHQRPPIDPGASNPVVRILSWDLLASAGADAQGFIVRDVLDSEADSIGTSLDAATTAARLVAACNTEGLAAAVKFRERMGSNPRVELNHSVLVDWTSRWLRVREIIATYAPDVVCFQQLDRMVDALPAMRELGYECSLPGAEGYVPLAHSEMASALHDSSDGSPSAEGYIAALTASGLAYAPSLSAASSAAAAAAAMAIHTDDCYGSSSGSQNSSEDSKRSVKVTDEPGVAIFWRVDIWEPATVEFLAMQREPRQAASVNMRFPERMGDVDLAEIANTSWLAAAARVLLTRVSDGAPLAVMTARLPSGHDASAEASRVRELTTRAVSGNFDGCFNDNGPPSLAEWIKLSADEAPTAICIGASSAPQRGEKATVWRTLRTPKGTVVRSVWDNWFSPEGKPRRAAGPHPITTNALRADVNAIRFDDGAEVGYHACACTDHIFFTDGLEMMSHAYRPVICKSPGDLLHSLLPSVDVPSDHYPVVVDFDFRPTVAPASSILAAAARRPSSRRSIMVGSRRSTKSRREVFGVAAAA